MLKPAEIAVVPSRAHAPASTPGLPANYTGPADTAAGARFEALRLALHAGKTVAVTAALVAQAEAVMPEIDAALRVDQPGAIAGWVANLAGMGLRNTPREPRECAAAGAALAEVLEGLPVVCFSKETRLAYARRSAFWPTPADMYAFLAEYRAVVLLRRHAAQWVLDRAAAMEREAAEAAEREAFRQELSSKLDSVPGRSVMALVVQTAVALRPPAEASPFDPADLEDIPAPVITSPRAACLPPAALAAAMRAQAETATPKQRDLLLARIALLEGRVAGNA